MDDGVLPHQPLPQFAEASGAVEGRRRTRLVASRPLPGEDWRGHCIRIARENLFRDWKAIDRSLREASDEPSDSLIELCARASDTNLVTYARSHTLLPLTGLLRGIQPTCSDQLRWSSYTISSFINRTGGSDMRFCPKCVKEDSLTLGYSYWRRDHQVPGRCKCSEHGMALNSMPGSTVCSELLLPSTNFGQSQTEEHGHQKDAVDRYLELCDAVLNYDTPIPIADIALRLRRHLRMNHKALCTAPSLSNYVQAAYPEGWLREVYPPLASKPHREILHSIDNFCISRSYARNLPSSAALLLTLAAIYSSTQEATSCLMLKPSPSESSAGVDEKILRHFLEGGDLPDCADKLGMSRAQVQKLLVQSRGEYFDAVLRPDITGPLREFALGSSMQDLREGLSGKNIQLMPLLRLLVADALEKNGVSLGVQESHRLMRMH